MSSRFAPALVVRAGDPAAQRSPAEGRGPRARLADRHACAEAGAGRVGSTAGVGQGIASDACANGGSRIAPVWLRGSNAGSGSVTPCLRGTTARSRIGSVWLIQSTGRIGIAPACLARTTAGIGFVTVCHTPATGGIGPAVLFPRLAIPGVGAGPNAGRQPMGRVAGERATSRGRSRCCRGAAPAPRRCRRPPGRRARARSCRG